VNQVFFPREAMERQTFVIFVIPVCFIYLPIEAFEFELLFSIPKRESPLNDFGLLWQLSRSNNWEKYNFQIEKNTFDKFQ